MTYAQFKRTLNYLVSIEWVYLPFDTMPDLGLTDDDEVTQALWEAYDGWETQDASTLPEGVEQTNFASPKPDWSVLMDHLQS